MQTEKREDGITVEILPFYDAENPLTAFDPLGKIHSLVRDSRCVHRGTVEIDRDAYHRLGDEGYARYLRLFHNALIVEEVYLTGDSSSFAVIDRDTFHEEYGDETPERIEDAKRYLQAQAAEYRCWLEGDCWGYVITFPDGEVDSCWGFYGDYVNEAVREAISGYVNEEGYPEPGDHYAALPCTTD